LIERDRDEQWITVEKHAGTQGDCPMPTIQISVINSSTAVADADVQAAMPDLQTQVSRDFAPAWGTDATLTFVPTGGTPDPQTWWLVILDNSDVAGALGYHDVTNQGLPLGKVFAGTDIQVGLSWTVTASHELLEMLADPEINLTVFVQPSADSGTLYSYEVCDACEDDSLGYMINATRVSDFVYPAYFETSRPAGSTQFDQQQKLNAPVPTLLPGGYIGAFDVTSGTGWHQITAEFPRGAQSRAASRARVGSRRERRRTARDQWVKSQPIPLSKWLDMTKQYAQVGSRR
jgi:hypothetical protein